MEETHMKNRIVHVISVLIECLKENGSTDAQVLLHTAYGFIQGDIATIGTFDKMCQKTHNENEFTLTDWSCVFNSDELKKFNNHEDDSLHDKPPIDTRLFITIKNVSIFKDYPNKYTMNMSQMIVFVDNIIGVSIIPRTQWQ